MKNAALSLCVEERSQSIPILSTAPSVGTSTDGAIPIRRLTAVDVSDEQRWKATDPEQLFREFAVTRNTALRDVLVDRFKQLVIYLAHKFANRGEHVEDLRQIAYIGLLKAIERFNPNAGAKFITYATPTIVGEIKRHFRDKGWMLKVPRRLQETHLALNRVTEALTRKLDRAPLITEIAEEMNVSVELVLEAQELGQSYSMLSLDLQAGAEDADKTSTLADFLGSPDIGFEHADAHVVLKEAFSRLKKQEQIVVYLSYYANMTQIQIAQRIGVSQMQVSRILKRAIDTLRQYVEPAPG